MPKLMALLTACLLFCGHAIAEDEPARQALSFSDLTGRIVLLLSAEGVVHCKGKGGLTVWINADTGLVPVPISKGPGGPTRLGQELVPHAEGLVLYVTEPFDPRGAQHVWTSWHDQKTRKFELTISAPSGIVGIEGRYGESFSPETLKSLLALSAQPVAEQ